MSEKDRTNEIMFFDDYQKLMNNLKALSKKAVNPFFKSKYVPLKTILAESRKICLECNFVFIQTPDVITGGDGSTKNVLITTLKHSSGEEIKSTILISSKDDNDPQKVGAGLTYMRRYSLTCILGIEEEDDDGNNASKPAKLKAKEEEEAPVEEKLLTTDEIEAIGVAMTKEELTVYYKANVESFNKRGLKGAFDKACADHNLFMKEMIGK